jgi:hypothetical protein
MRERQPSGEAAADRVWTGNSSALPGLSNNVRNVHVTSLQIS